MFIEILLLNERYSVSILERHIDNVRKTSLFSPKHLNLAPF